MCHCDLFMSIIPRRTCESTIKCEVFFKGKGFKLYNDVNEDRKIKRASSMFFRFYQSWYMF